jgi:hypothetical protein
MRKKYIITYTFYFNENDKQPINIGTFIKETKTRIYLKVLEDSKFDHLYKDENGEKYWPIDMCKFFKTIKEAKEEFVKMADKYYGYKAAGRNY